MKLLLAVASLCVLTACGGGGGASATVVRDRAPVQVDQGDAGDTGEAELQKAGASASAAAISIL